MRVEKDKKLYTTALNYGIISSIIEEYSILPVNTTNYMQGILKQIKDYFKEFQKQPLQMYRPFEAIGQI